MNERRHLQLPFLLAAVLSTVVQAVSTDPIDARAIRESFLKQTLDLRRDGVERNAAS